MLTKAELTLIFKLAFIVGAGFEIARVIISNIIIFINKLIYDIQHKQEIITLERLGALLLIIFIVCAITGLVSPFVNK